MVGRVGPGGWGWRAILPDAVSRRYARISCANPAGRVPSGLLKFFGENLEIGVVAILTPGPMVDGRMAMARMVDGC
jgi:hypothetical protein